MAEQELKQEEVKKEEIDQKVDSKIEVPVAQVPIDSKKKELIRRFRLRGKKKLMILNLIKRLGIVKYACQDTGITRWVHWNWLRVDENYKKAFDAVNDEVDDTIEMALLQLVVDKNPQAVIHTAKTRLKKRGYGENIEQEIKHNEPLRLIIVDPKAP